MYEVRVHGRDHLLVCAAMETMALAAVVDHVYFQIGPPPRAPRPHRDHVGWCRLDRRLIRASGPVRTPDCLIVIDAGLPGLPDATVGLPPGGLVIAGSAGPAVLDPPRDGWDLAVVPAVRLPRVPAAGPEPVAALLGAFTALTGRLRLDAVRTAAGIRFGACRAPDAMRAVEEAYDLVRAGQTAHGYA
ncbi:MULTISPECIES: hypothetical protein [Catenuloplanes]|uniref:Pyruvate/2-oxoacid:ferredoxin oxidoreductase gamma subunit n=1 Tax=Catenuloplanes niger TaxID=587534 RepID=A0AAE4A130_9ACTN|nr:hypothetical protein [Catenuloplanes niger]MDR7327653.1 Pyruvate/2-oxoacid:ferredoxin oxidoreductase gamma subunit [Catenuloplanes niger]